MGIDLLVVIVVIMVMVIVVVGVAFTVIVVNIGAVCQIFSKSLVLCNNKTKVSSTLLQPR